MGSPRHQRPNPEGTPRAITDEWRARAKKQLALNKQLRSKVSGDNGPPRDYASLARAIGTDSVMVSLILGPARSTTKVKKKLAKTSVLVDRICEVLDIPPPTRDVDLDDDLAGELEELSDREKSIIGDLVRDPDRAKLVEALAVLMRRRS